MSIIVCRGGGHGEDMECVGLEDEDEFVFVFVFVFVL